VAWRPDFRLQGTSRMDIPASLLLVQKIADIDVALTPPP
jgi:hypothetical protein